jgi:Domain of unknown function (DUF4412)
MKKLAAIAATALILAVAAMAQAGVVVDERQIVDQPNGTKLTRTRTVLIEGNKQKSIIDDGSRSIITNLNNGTMTIVDKPRKSYVQFPFPPRSGPLAAMQGNMMPTINFKKTGAHETMLGYSCDVYTGSGTVGTNAVKMTGCFSTTAPGANDYTDFQHEMARKVKGTAMTNMGQIPDGVPLKLVVTTKMGNVSAPGMSPEQSAKINRMLANREFVTNTHVTKITTENVPPDSFEVPAGYQKQQVPAMFGGMGNRPLPPAGGAATKKVPE